MTPDPALLATAIEAVVRAGELQMAKFNTAIRVDMKGAIDLVTEVDLEVERMFRAMVSERFPDHDVLAEEQGLSSTGSRFRWVFDPLDGTTNFAHGVPIFCASLALEIDGDAVIGIGPGVAVGRAAPGAHQIALGVELQHWRGRGAAVTGWRVLRGANLRARIQGLMPMHDVHVVAGVHAHSNDRANHPAIGQRLGPEWIDLKMRCLHRLLRQRCAQTVLPDREPEDACSQHGAHEDRSLG